MKEASIGCSYVLCRARAFHLLFGARASELSFLVSVLFSVGRFCFLVWTRVRLLAVRGRPAFGHDPAFDWDIFSARIPRPAEEARCPGSTDAAQAFGAGVGHQESGCIFQESLTHPFATVVKLLSRVPSLDGVLDRHSKPPNKGGSFSDGENKHPCRSDQRVLGE